MPMRERELRTRFGSSRSLHQRSRMGRTPKLGDEGTRTSSEKFVAGNPEYNS
jgi:hypothetical protein